MNEVKLSTLRCEPYFADSSDCKEHYYGLPQTVLWRVYIDDAPISKGTLPFFASSETVELEANKCFPYFGDGGDYVIVRLAVDKIVWFGFYPYYTFAESKLLIDTVYVFDAIHYRQAIEQATTALSQPKPAQKSEPSFLHKLFDYMFGTHDVKSTVKPVSTATRVKPLPILTSQELKTTLLDALPYDFDLPLYRMPELADDRRGERLYRAVWEAISLGEIRISEPPPTAIEIRIGLDKDVFVESLWQAGIIGDDVAILFVSEPRFPLWISGFRSIIPLLGDALNTLGTSKQDV